MKSKFWIIGFIILTITPLATIAFWVVKIDPYFHYHKPDTSRYYYSFVNERSQNDGISRNFDYEGLITGSSVTMGFKTTEAEELFGYKFIKVPYSSGSFKEINDNLKAAMAHNKNVKVVIRALDMGMFMQDKDYMWYGVEKYPTYLYNENPLDDMQYLFNRDVVFESVYGMVTENDHEGFEPGIDDFDSYGSYMPYATFGPETVLGVLFPNGIAATDRSVLQEDLTEEERERLLGNVRQNITSLATNNPQVTFYYFIPPCCVTWWQGCINDGTFNKQMQAERIVIEEILKTENIRIYSFNNLTEITTDLNNYMDNVHYAEWINSLILGYIKEDKCLLTQENYEDYLRTEESFYWSFDYENCYRKQEDYEDDYYAATVLNEKLNCAESEQ